MTFPVHDPQTHTHTHVRTHTRRTPLLHFAQDIPSLIFIIFHPCSSPFLTFCSSKLAIHSHCLFLPYDHNCCTAISVFLLIDKKLSLHLFILTFLTPLFYQTFITLNSPIVFTIPNSSVSSFCFLFIGMVPMHI